MLNYLKLIKHYLNATEIHIVPIMPIYLSMNRIKITIFTSKKLIFLGLYLSYFIMINIRMFYFVRIFMKEVTKCNKEKLMKLSLLHFV